MTPKDTKQQAVETDIVAKLSKVVEEAIESIANTTGLSTQEVIKVIEEVKEVELEQSIQAAIQEAIKKISIATDLNTDEISRIFKENRTASLGAITKQLHKKSKSDRVDLEGGFTHPKKPLA